MSQKPVLSLFDEDTYVTTIIGKRVINGIHYYICQSIGNDVRFEWNAEDLPFHFTNQIAHWESTLGNRLHIEYITRDDEDQMDWHREEDEEEENGEIQGAEGEGNEKEDTQSEDSQNDDSSKGGTYHPDDDLESSQPRPPIESLYGQSVTPDRRRPFNLTPEKLPSKKRCILPPSMAEKDQGDIDDDSDEAVNEDDQTFNSQMLAQTREILEISQALSICARANLGRGGTIDNEEQEMGGSSQEIDLCISDIVATRLLSAYNSSFADVVKWVAFIPELPNDSWGMLYFDDIAPKKRLLVQRCAICMLAASNDDIIRHLINGDLPKAYWTDPELKSVVDKLRPSNAGVRKPSIYINYLVDRRGNSPTPAEIEAMLVTIELYMDRRNQASRPHAMEIDTRMCPPTGNAREKRKDFVRAGMRRYLDSSKDDRNANPREGRSKEVRKFIIALRRRLSFSADRNAPLPRALCEVGYATYPITRISQHQNHESSNYIMNLLEAVCMLEHPEYRIQSYVVFNCFKPIHAHIGEIFFTRLTQSYTTHGGGFNHFPAGISNFHAWDPDVKHYREIYNKTVTDPTYRKRLDKEAELDISILEAWNGLLKSCNELKEARIRQSQEMVTLKRLEAEAAQEEHDRNMKLLENMTDLEGLAELLLSFEGEGNEYDGEKENKVEDKDGGSKDKGKGKEGKNDKE